MTRPAASERGYDTKWKQARRAYLVQHPYCVKCRERGELIEATVVDHIIPHKQDWKLFWDRNNWQPLCEPHHNSLKAKEEHRGYVIGCDIAGRPIDPRHPWNSRKT